MKLGILIPEFPGQTHSFFWREIVELRRRHGLDPKIFSTRLPARPVQHEWVAEAEAEYLYPLGLGAGVGLLPTLIARLPRVMAHRESRALLAQPRNWALLILAARLLRLCQRHGIDHLHAHSCANAALLAALCRRLGGPPYSLTLHGALRDYGGDQDYKWRNAAHVFTVSETLKREVGEIMPDTAPRIRVAPMGVDTDFFRPRPDPRDKPETFRWLVCARLNPGKGYDTLLAAATSLAAEHDFEIRIAGEDEQGGLGYRKTLEAIIAQRGVGDRIKLLGALPQSGVLAELQAADGFVLPSLHEALGVAYMEAMACELPVVGSRTGGVPEVIEDGVTGLLVLPGDADGLAGAMARIMREPDIRGRLGKAAREKIVADFGASRSADALFAALSGTDRR